MKKILSTSLIPFFQSYIVFFCFVAIIIFSLNLTPIIKHIRNAPSGRTFILMHNNTQDFFFYQAIMNEGANGDWLTSDPYTTENHQQSIIFSYFLWFGKISKLIGLPFTYTYHLIRLLFGFFLLGVSFYLILLLRVPFPRLSLLFFVFASPYLHQITDYDGKTITVPYMYWWTGIDAVRRVAYLPHHMIGGFLFIVSLIFLYRFFQTHKQKFFIISCILIPLLAFFHTPSLFILLIILPPAVTIYTIFHREILKKKQSRIWLIGMVVYAVIGTVALALMVSQTSKGFPWSQYIDWEKRLQFPLHLELIPAFGVLFPIAMVGSLRAFLSRKFEWIVIVCWFFIPYLLIPYAKVLGISNIRLIQGVPYLALALLATLGVKTICDLLILHFLPSVRKKPWDAGLIQFVIILLSLFIFIRSTIPTLQWGVKDQIREFMPIYGNVYFDNRLFDAFAYINRTFPNKSISLGTFYTQNYLPAFTHTRSYIGHSGYTYNVDEKQKLVGDFFANKMTDPQAYEFLKQNHIDLVFQGPEEKPIYSQHLYPSVLVPSYDTSEITIYTVKI